MEASKARYDETRGLPIREGLWAAARFLYLNRLAFNGIFRVNQRGEFNVPYAGDRSLNYFKDGERLRRASEALRGIELKCCDFEDALASADEGDLAYCDPVYLSSTAEGFSRYTNSPFDVADLDRLMACIGAAVTRGAKVILSYSGSEPIPTTLPGRETVFQRRSTVHSRARTAATVTERLVLYSR
jgi:DNA adenine methylase